MELILAVAMFVGLIIYGITLFSVIASREASQKQRNILLLGLLPVAFVLYKYYFESDGDAIQSYSRAIEKEISRGDCVGGYSRFSVLLKNIDEDNLIDEDQEKLEEIMTKLASCFQRS